jgi:uncharacterized membrane protein YhiD involved in acid resistance
MSNGTLTIINVLICVITAIILGLIIGYVHMKTSKYGKNFVITLAILPLLVSIVIMMVNGNLGTSVAVLGAFSLIRFRSIPGNSREIASIFWAMAIGLAIGMGQIFFAVLVTIIISVILVLFYRTKFGDKNYTEYILKIIIPEDLDYEEVFDSILTKYTDNYNLLKIETTNMGSLFELKYSITFKEDVKNQDFINELRIKNGNLKINLSHPLINEEL